MISQQGKYVPTWWEKYDKKERKKKKKGHLNNKHN